MQSNKYTIITGASTGLGKQIAMECAKLGRNLILTALPGEQIKELETQLTARFEISVHTYETNITENNAVEKMASLILDNYEIDMLINNAGVGSTKPFLEATPEYIDQIVLLNMRAMVLLTRLLLPNLKKTKESSHFKYSKYGIFRTNAI
jgi:short-subunit dehydrogenase